MLERSNLILRDVEDWESDWLNYKFDRRQAEAKAYPQALLDQFTASSTVLEGGGGSSSNGSSAAEGGGEKKKGKKEAAAAAEEAAAEGEEAPSNKAADAKPSAAPTQAGGLDSFYERGGSAQNEDEKKAGLVVAQRVTAADGIGDTRSLDRAYSQRLVLIVKDRATGQWGLPSGLRQQGEPMARAAERSLRFLFGSSDPTVDVWYTGAAPVGHWLQVYSPEKQKESGCYGAKVFFYRAEILNGKFTLPRGEPGDDRHAASFPYDDFHWLSRDETEAFLPRPFYKYIHQVIGAGAGEEHARREAWLKRIAAKGLTPAQASGRRNFRVASARRIPNGGDVIGVPRLAAVATQAQAALAATPFTPGGSKAADVRAEFGAFRQRLRAQAALSEKLRTSLATPPASVVAAARDAEKRAKHAQLESQQQ